MERRYVPADLCVHKPRTTYPAAELLVFSAHARRATLIEYVQRQIDKWPTDRLGKFKKKANMDTMRSVLLAEPFTTTKPMPSMPGLGTVYFILYAWPPTLCISVSGPSNPMQPSQSTVHSGLVGQQNLGE